MRVAIGGLSHETNTFSPRLAGLDDFQVAEGDAIAATFQATSTPVGGFLDAAREKGWSVAPTLVAIATPGGVVERKTFDLLSGRLFDGLRRALPVDAVLLRQHGALVTEDHADGDAWILEQVRAIVGPSVPVGATLDLHANLSRRMVDAVDMLIGYDTYPHVDGYDRARELADWIERIAAGRVRLASALGKPRVLAALPTMFTEREPMASMVRRAHEWESALDGVITVAGGFPYADVEEAGFGILGYAPVDRAAALENAVAELSRQIEADSGRYAMRGIPVTEAAVRAAHHRGPRALVLADMSDNPGAGTPCDGTVLLRALVDAKVPDALLLALYDPHAAEMAHAAGVGAELDLLLGGHTDDRHGAPLPLRVRVDTLTDGAYVHQGPMSTGMRAYMGRTAVLRADGVRICVTERRSQPIDLGMVTSLGIDPAAVAVYALKSSVHYRAAFAPIAQEILEVDTPGISNPDFRQLPFRTVRRPIAPLDPVGGP